MKSLKAKFRKSDTNEWNKNDDRLLQAVENGDPEKVASLLGKKGASATKQDSEGKTALLMKMLNKTGPTTGPWGTPLVTDLQLDCESLLSGLCCVATSQSISLSFEPECSCLGG